MHIMFIPRYDICTCPLYFSIRMLLTQFWFSIVEQECPNKRHQVSYQLCLVEDGAAYSRLTKGLMNNLLHLYFVRNKRLEKVDRR